MAVQKISIAQFIALSKQYPVLDVRSPGEYAHAHIPGAYSLPLFSDEERKVVGTAYKQESREKAIKTGLDYFGGKMRFMVEEVEGLLKENTSLNHHGALVHCWRGGMRSEGVAWLLDLYGFKIFTLAGGYKSYRKWARTQFQQPNNYRILSGYTGSGKTKVLQELKSMGQPVIDLEGLANHKGSAFGALGQSTQPSQEMFENRLAEELFAVSGGDNPVYIEDESRRIGLVSIPDEFWKLMQKSPIQFIDIPFEERLQHITQEYGAFDKESLVNAILRIQKRLGGQETKTAINHLLENNQQACFSVLLKYYDKCYSKTLLNRENMPSPLNKITCASVDVKTITNILINERAIAL